MDVLLSAVVSDLVGRLFSFLIGKYQERGATDTAGRLQRALLRARVVVEEAEGRQIAHRAMLQQLNQLRRELCRAAYALDTFRWRATDSNRIGRFYAMVSPSQSHTRPLPSSHCSDVLPIVVESLEAALRDMRQFMVLLGACPHVTRQPYNTYLFMERCMFGRQMEKEHVISFLLQPAAQDLHALPIIGPQGVGKRTLVEHVCLDERVRERFTKIYRLRSDELDLHTYENHWSLFDLTARVLMVIHIVDADVDAEESWRRFHSNVERHMHKGSKIIVISRMKTHSSIGTVPALRLCAPRRDELWYFFRALAFGAADPDEHPDLARLGMMLCAGIIGNFALFTMANIIATSLHTDLSVRSWRRLLKVNSEMTVLQLDVAGDGLHEDKGKYYFLSRPVKVAPGAPCSFYNWRKLTGMAQSELPKVTMVELLTGASLPPVGEMQFDVLVWQSRIPPYASYVATCDTDRAHHQQALALKTRLVNKRRRDDQEMTQSN